MEEVDMTIAFEATKKQFIDDLDVKVEKGITEKASADFLKRLIENIETEEDLLALQSLATLYKKSGFVFTPVQEKLDNTIKYLSKNEEKSFDQGGIHHKLIVGDNYPALQNLLITHRGKINVIYIDPPYGKDGMGAFADTNYENAISRDNLLSMLHPRLLLARQLLTEDGIIFCSIDDKNQAYLKGLFDEIFGEENFIACLPRVTKKGGKSSTAVANNHDYCLIYVKDKEFADLQGLSHTDENFKYEDEFVKDRGLYKLNQTLDYDSLQYVASLDYPIELDGQIFYPGGSEEAYAIRQTGQHDRADWAWRWSRELFDFGLANGFIEVKTGGQRPRIYTKTYQNAKIVKGNDGYEIQYIDRTKPMSTLEFSDNEYSNDNATKSFRTILEVGAFDYTKPVNFITKLITIATSFRDITVLDFFAGSGTAGQAVLELNRQDGGNRQFILCTNNEEADGFIADNVTTKRLKRVMTGECYDGTKDFKWLDNNEPYGDSLDVYNIESVSSFASAQPSAIDVIDEANYGKSFDNVNDKIAWVCQNFHVTQKSIPPYGEVEFDA